jgi:DNA-binding IclR family transcriptional regulator
MNEPRNPVQAVQTTIGILEALKDGDGAGITELAAELDLTKGTVHNHLSTLADRGFVVKEDDQYHVGLRFFEFGEYAKGRQEVYRLAKSEVENLADTTGKLANLLVEEHGRGIYLHRAKGNSTLSLDTGAGSRVHLHNTALGKAILANLSRERVDAILDTHGMPAETENTITDREALYAELAGIRDRGYAFDREERAEGIRCVAAPIRTNDGRILGAISVAGAKSRMRGDHYESELPEMVHDAASVIGINATYS